VDEKEDEPIPESLAVEKFTGLLTLKNSPEKHRELTIR